MSPKTKPPNESSNGFLGALLAGRWEEVRATEGSLRGRAHKVVSAYATWHLDRSLRSLPFLRTN